MSAGSRERRTSVSPPARRKSAMEVDRGRGRFSAVPAAAAGNGATPGSHPPAPHPHLHAHLHPHRGLVWQRDEWSLAPDRTWLPALGGGLLLTTTVIVLLAWSHQRTVASAAAGGESSPAFRLFPAENVAPPE